MTTPTWRQQNIKAAKQAAIIVPALAVVVGACCVGANLLPDNPVPADSRPTATAEPTRSAGIFNPGAEPTSGTPTGTPAGPAEVAEPTLPPAPKPPPPPPPPRPNPPPPPEPEPEEEDDVYYANCAEARAAGAAPIHRSEPGYRRALDRDGDGVACD